MLPVLVAVLIGLGTVYADLSDSTTRPLDVLGWGLLVLTPLTLVLRRIHPPMIFLAVMVSTAVYLGLSYPFGPIFSAGFVALGSTVLTGHRVAAYTTTAGSVLVLFVLDVMLHPDRPIPFLETVSWLAWLAAFIGGCEAWRHRRERVAQTRATREATELWQGSDERLRIARELHDLLGHHVSLINVQAGVALFLMDDDPEQARTALTTIKQSSRDLLGEMRATLGILRGLDAPPHHPSPGVDQLDALVADTRAAGLPVEFAVRGRPRALSSGIDLAVYRIVQESLTNVRRHAGPAHTWVSLDYSATSLTVEVEDNGTAATTVAETGGNGVAGIKERAHALGGTSSVGRGPRGGFRVRVCLPLNLHDD